MFYNAPALCANEFGGKAPGITFFRKFEEKVHQYEGEQTVEGLKGFLKPLLTPIVFAFSDDEVEMIFGEQ